MPGLGFRSPLTRFGAAQSHYQRVTHGIRDKRYEKDVLIPI